MMSRRLRDGFNDFVTTPYLNCHVRKYKIIIVQYFVLCQNKKQFLSQTPPDLNFQVFKDDLK